MQPSIPSDTCEENDSDLTTVENYGANVPARSFRQLAAREYPFPNEEKDGHSDNQSPGKSHASLRAMKICIALTGEYLTRASAALPLMTEREASHEAAGRRE